MCKIANLNCNSVHENQGKSLKKLFLYGWFPFPQCVRRACNQMFSVQWLGVVKLKTCARGGDTLSEADPELCTEGA